MRPACPEAPAGIRERRWLSRTRKAVAGVHKGGLLRGVMKPHREKPMGLLAIQAHCVALVVVTAVYPPPLPPTRRAPLGTFLT